MRLKSAIAMMLCITGLPSLTSADNFFGNLTEQLKTKINKANDELNRVNTQVDQADDLANQADDQIGQTATELIQAGTQARQSISDARDFAILPGTGVANNMDVIGLRLGMTAQEAKTALQTHDATMRIQEQHSQLSQVPNSKYLHQIVAISNTGEQVVMEFAPPPREPVVVRLMRTTQYAGGARPTLVDTLQALRQKYGSPTIENNQTRMHLSFWLHDGAGNKMTTTSAAQVQHCTQASRVSVDQLMASQQQDRVMAGCGASLNIQLGTGIKSDGLVGNLIATLSNPAEMVRTTQKTRAYINENIRTQAGSVGAPKL